MSSVEYLREFVSDRLTAAAEEIFGVFQKMIVQYEEEIDRQRRLLDVVWKPEVKLLRAELPQQFVHEKDVRTDQGREFRLDQEDPQPPQIKEEQEEICIVQVEEQLLLKGETGAFMFPPIDDENDRGDVQTLCLNPDETPVDESVVNMSCVASGPSDSSRSHPSMVQIDCNRNTVSNLLICTTCGKEFSHKSNYQKHLRSHTGEKPFSCTFCTKTFSQRSSLNLHLRTHRGEKPYVCETCGKGFVQRSDLTVHIRRVHTGEKPYRCKTCGKCFPANNDLSVHVKIHTGHKPFTCVTCGKGFKRAYLLAVHIRKDHIGEKRFVCVCGKGYFTTYELSRHQKTHLK